MGNNENNLDRILSDAEKASVEQRAREIEIKIYRGEADSSDYIELEDLKKKYPKLLN